METIEFKLRDPVEIIGPNCLGERECDGDVGHIVAMNDKGFFAVSSTLYPEHCWGMIWYPPSSLRLREGSR